jgi:hypothetical protein
MKRGTIDNLCEQINNARGVVYPQVGYLMYANIAGDGRRHRTVYAVINPDGGLCAVHNSYSTRVTVSNLRRVLADTKGLTTLHDGFGSFSVSLDPLKYR